MQQRQIFGGAPVIFKTAAESEQVNRALARNYDALKTRLRQLGFFVDLADASNSQVIEPRFTIAGADLEAA